MALKDLIVSNQKITEDLLENVLRGYVELIQDGKKVLLTKKALFLSARAKVLLFLAGGNAWTLIDGVQWLVSPSEMEDDLGIGGNTLRPTLKNLSDNYLVKSEDGKYKILPKGIYELERSLKDGTALVQKSGNSNQTTRDSKSKQPRSPSKSEILLEMRKDGFFDSPKELQEIHAELGRRAATTKITSIPSLILPMIRKKELSREYKQKTEGKVWVYKLPKKYNSV